MIDMVGNHLLVNMNWSYHEQKNSNDLSQNPYVSYFQTKRNDKVSLCGNKTSLQNKDQKSFINPSYISDTITVNYTRSLPQHLLHTIINNKNMSRK